MSESTHAGVIPVEQRGVVRRWQAPAVSAGVEPPAQTEAPAAERAGVLTAEQLERIQQVAYDEGFAFGRREGQEAGRDDAQVRVERLAELLDELAEPFASLDEQVERELVALAVAIARHLVRRELKTQPDEIVRVVREAVQALPGAAREVRLCLHPDDATLVRETMPAVESEHAWTIVEDPALSAGGCRVESQHSRIDASVESRLNAAVAAALGGERRDDREATPAQDDG